MNCTSKSIINEQKNTNQITEAPKHIHIYQEPDKEENMLDIQSVYPKKLLLHVHCKNNSERVWITLRFMSYNLFVVLLTDLCFLHFIGQLVKLCPSQKM